MTDTASKIARFWAPERARRGATEAELTAAEAAIGHPLPAELRAILAVRDGGTAHFGNFTKGGVLYPLGAAMFGWDLEAAPFDLVEAYRRRADFETPDDVVLFSSEGHVWFGLDYRDAPGSPAVVYGEDDEEPIRLADTFTEFFAGLTADD